MSNCIYRSDLHSTNAFLSNWIQQYERKLIKENIPEYTVVYTDYQTKGRGQQQHTWESEKNKNLLMSIVLYPEIHPSQQFIISQRVSLAICNFLINTLHIQDVSIKWANDIYVNDKKIAGILVEHILTGEQIFYSIIGIGLNINQESFLPWIPNPTSILLETGKNLSIETTLAHIINHIKTHNTLDTQTIQQHYFEKLYKRNVFANYKIISTQEIVLLKIKNVETSGLLVTEDNSGNNRTFHFNEIQYIL